VRHVSRGLLIPPVKSLSLYGQVSAAQAKSCPIYSAGPTAAVPEQIKTDARVNPPTRASRSFSGRPGEQIPPLPPAPTSCAAITSTTRSYFPKRSRPRAPGACKNARHPCPGRARAWRKARYLRPVGLRRRTYFIRSGRRHRPPKLPFCSSARGSPVFNRLFAPPPPDATAAAAAAATTAAPLTNSRLFSRENPLPPLRG
jgi:hypothetical protein